jgi:nitrilase
MRRDSPEMDRVKAACKEADVYVVLGYSERDAVSIYIAQAFISNEGGLVHNRRKIKPPHVERALWGNGQVDSLKVVVDTPYGKLGALNCWENLQPLLRYNEYAQGCRSLWLAGHRFHDIRMKLIPVAV